MTTFTWNTSGKYHTTVTKCHCEWWMRAENGIRTVLWELWLYFTWKQNYSCNFGVWAENVKIRNIMQVLVDLSETSRNCVFPNVSERKILSSEHPFFVHGSVKYKQQLAWHGAVCTTIYVTQEGPHSFTEQISSVHATLHTPHLTREPSGVLYPAYALQAERLKTLSSQCPVTEAPCSLASQCSCPAQLYYLCWVTPLSRVTLLCKR